MPTSLLGPVESLFLRALPTPARLYYESIVKGKRDPITEKDFTPEELAAMRELVKQGQDGGVTYAAYGDDPAFGLRGMFSPKGRVANSLGQFTYQQGPGGTTVSDNYDFNPTYTTETPLIQALSLLGTGGFSGLHSIGEWLMPPGKGRPVQIKLPDE